jgi:hypothetical protein
MRSPMRFMYLTRVVSSSIRNDATKVGCGCYYSSELVIKTEQSMKTLSFLVLCLLAQGVMVGQQPLSSDEALAQLYHAYDSKKMTAQWICDGGKKRDGGAWPCTKDYSTVDVSQILLTEVREGDIQKLYLVTSAVPANSLGGYDCHACAPAIGVAVFARKADRWELQSANAAIGFYGGWGGPPEADLITIGPEKHGVMLSIDHEGQGYSSTWSVLLAPVGKVVDKVWSIDDEQDDSGAYDPAGVDGPKVKYRSSAAHKFIVPEDYNGGGVEYYDIEIISRGQDERDTASRLKSENWTEIYRFSDGKYQLFNHTDFSEARKATSSSVKQH